VIVSKRTAYFRRAPILVSESPDITGGCLPYAVSSIFGDDPGRTAARARRVEALLMNPDRQVFALVFERRSAFFIFWKLTTADGVLTTPEARKVNGRKAPCGLQ